MWLLLPCAEIPQKTPSCEVAHFGGFVLKTASARSNVFTGIPVFDGIRVASSQPDIIRIKKCSRVHKLGHGEDANRSIAAVKCPQPWMCPASCVHDSTPFEAHPGFSIAAARGCEGIPGLQLAGGLTRASGDDWAGKMGHAACTRH